MQGNLGPTELVHHLRKVGILENYDDLETSFLEQSFSDEVFKPNATPLQHDPWWFESDMDEQYNFSVSGRTNIITTLPYCNQCMWILPNNRTMPMLDNWLQCWCMAGDWQVNWSQCHGWSATDFTLWCFSSEQLWSYQPFLQWILDKGSIKVVVLATLQTLERPHSKHLQRGRWKGLDPTPCGPGFRTWFYGQEPQILSRKGRDQLLLWLWLEQLGIWLESFNHRSYVMGFGNKALTSQVSCFFAGRWLDIMHLMKLKFKQEPWLRWWDLPDPPTNPLMVALQWQNSSSTSCLIDCDEWVAWLKDNISRRIDKGPLVMLVHITTAQRLISRIRFLELVLDLTMKPTIEVQLFGVQTTQQPQHFRTQSLQTCQCQVGWINPVLQQFP